MSNEAVTQQLYDLLVAQLTAMSVTDIPAIEDVTFGDVTLYAPGVINLDQPTARNSSVLVTYGEEPVQTLSLHYNRLHLPTLTALFPNPALDETFEAAESVYDVLEEIAGILKCDLTEEDLEDLPITENADGLSYDVPLVARPNSLFVFGTSQLVVPAREAAPLPPPPEPPVDGGGDEEPPVDGGDDGEEDPPAEDPNDGEEEPGV